MIDASFLWSEPHSKRMKIKITFEKELNQEVKIEQKEVVEYIEVYTQCSDCKKKFTPHDWNTVVQVRQHVNHKKTILNLEQLILKQGFSEKMLKVEDCDNGINFFFKNFNLGQKFCDFIKSSYPCTVKSSKQPVSHNEKDNTSNVKTTISITIAKICRDDLVKVPKKLSK